MTAVPLGMPQALVLRRRVSRQVRVGSMAMGGGAPISVQSMTTTRTSDINATLQRIARITTPSSPVPRASELRSTSMPWPNKSPPLFHGFPMPLRIAVTGCVVNGPGEAREADLGGSAGNDKAKSLSVAKSSRPFRKIILFKR